VFTPGFATFGGCFSAEFPHAAIGSTRPHFPTRRDFNSDIPVLFVWFRFHITILDSGFILFIETRLFFFLVGCCCCLIFRAWSFVSVDFFVSKWRSICFRPVWFGSFIFSLKMFYLLGFFFVIIKKE